MKIFRPKNKVGFTLVEIMIVVLIIGILLAIAIPNFVTARESSRAKACVANLKQIDSATQQFCMDNKISSSNYSTSKPATVSALVGTNLYIRTQPACPSSGTYTIAPQITDSPYCTVSGNATNTAAVTGTSTGTDYLSGGRFYHGL